MTDRAIEAATDAAIKAARRWAGKEYMASFSERELRKAYGRIARAALSAAKKNRRRN